MVAAMFFILNADIGWHFAKNPQIFTSFETRGYMPIPTANLTKKTTLSGLEVWSPVEGDQCWNSIILCTPNFNANLTFIDNNIFPEFTVNDRK